jgi:hypothetical protein
VVGQMETTRGLSVTTRETCGDTVMMRDRMPPIGRSRLCQIYFWFYIYIYISIYLSIYLCASSSASAGVSLLVCMINSWVCSASHYLSQLIPEFQFSRLVMDELVGPGSDETYRAVMKSRLQKSVRLLSDPSTIAKLSAFAIVLQPCNMFMGYLFRSGKLTSQHSILEIADVQTSPITKLLEFYWGKMCNLDDDYWLVLRPADGWTQETLQHAINTTLTMFGSLHMRLIRIFEFWPLCLWRLAKPGMSVASRMEFLRTQFRPAQVCCLDSFSRFVKESAACDDDLVLPDGVWRRKLQAAFERCPCTNILSEDRFARARHHQSASRHHGRKSGIR